MAPHKDPSEDQISADRLVEAAQAALLAAIEVEEYTRGERPYPLDLMGSPLQPDCLAEFTYWEIQQACQFLVRMGMIERPRRSEGV